MNYLFLIIAIVFIITGVLVTKRFFNPLTIFNLVWGVIFALYQLRISSLQSELSNETINLLIICIVVFSVFFIISYCIKFSKRKNIENNSQKIFDYNLIKKLFIFWIFVEIVETIYSGGLPMLWKMTGSSKTYFDYGIPTVHGLMNSVGLVITMLAFYLYLHNKTYKNEKNKKLLLIIGFVLFFYLLLITRQVIISAIIQMVIIYLFFLKKIPWKKLIVLMIGIIVAFGIIGNVRTGYDSFLNVAMINTEINPLFIGVYWVYMYLTMTLANVNNAVNLGITGYGAFKLFETYLPTVITNIIFSDDVVDIPNFLVTQAFNVSGFFIEFYTGFGTIGVATISAVYGVLGGIIFKKVTKIKSEKNILYYSIYVQIIVLSFFYNHLFYLPSGFQFVIVYLVYKFIKSKEEIT